MFRGEFSCSVEESRRLSGNNSKPQRGEKKKGLSILEEKIKNQPYIGNYHTQHKYRIRVPALYVKMLTKMTTCLRRGISTGVAD